MPRKTVIGINIATSASRSIGNLRWLRTENRLLLSAARQVIVKVERRGSYIHQRLHPEPVLGL